MNHEEYEQKLTDEKIKDIAEYKDKLISILDNDIDKLIETYKFEPEEGKTPDAADFVYDLSYGEPSAESGFILNNSYNSELFEENTSYVVVNVAGGGPTVDFIIGSDGDVFLRHSYAGTDLIEIDGRHIDSPLYRYAETYCGESFTENDFEMDDYECSLREKREIGYNSFVEYVDDVYDFEELSGAIEFNALIKDLKSNDYDLDKTITNYIENGDYNDENENGSKLKIKDLESDVLKVSSILEKITELDSYEDMADYFGVDAEKLTNIDNVKSKHFNDSDLKEQFLRDPIAYRRTNRLKI